MVSDTAVEIQECMLMDVMTFLTHTSFLMYANPVNKGAAQVKVKEVSTAIPILFYALQHHLQHSTNHCIPSGPTPTLIEEP